jgi:hypothetical protein
MMHARTYALLRFAVMVFCAPTLLQALPVMKRVMTAMLTTMMAAWRVVLPRFAAMAFCVRTSARANRAMRPAMTATLRTQIHVLTTV